MQEKKCGYMHHPVYNWILTLSCFTSKMQPTCIILGTGYSEYTLANNELFYLGIGSRYKTLNYL